MKKATALLLFFICFGHFISDAQSTDETAVRNILSRQSAAWNQGNLEGFMEGYWKNDSLVFIGKKGLQYGWDNTLNNYRKSYPDVKAMGHLVFTILLVKYLSDSYQEVIGKWHLTREDGDLEGHFTLLFQKIKNEWVIVMDHSS